MSQIVSSPPKPWKSGVHADYAAFKIAVTVCQDSQQRVWSDHDFDTALDQQVAHGLNQRGTRHIAHALLTEAVRREAFLCGLIQQAKDESFLAHWSQAGDVQKDVLERELREAVEQVLIRVLPKLVPGAVRDVLSMMAAQLPGQERKEG